MAAPKGNQFAKDCKTNGRPRTPPETWKERIHAVLDFARKEDSYSIYSFAHQYEKPSSTIKGWCDENNEFSEAYEYAKEIIGERRYQKGLQGEFNATLSEKTHALYNKDYADWQREMKDKKNQDSTIQVVMKSFNEEPSQNKCVSD